MAGMTPTYPKRPAFFANKAVRAMVKTCVAQEHGQGVFSLLCVIAHTEDARHYTSPVTFWNEQLAAVAGFANVKAMDRQRTKAVESGWLVYIPGGNRTPGKYWVCIPPKFSDLDDNPSDEGAFAIEEAGTSNNVQTSNLTNEVGNEPGMKWESNRDRSGVRTGNEVGNEPGSNRAPFYPIPNPVPNPDVASATSVIVAKEKPKPSRRFIPPTVDEVQAYCTERDNAVDPETFVNFYAAKGWKIGANTMKDWRACVRTWEKNDADRRFAGAGQSAGHVLATSGNIKRGGFATHEYDREAANNAALAAFLLEEGVLPGDARAHHTQKNLQFHAPAIEGLVLRSEAVPGAGGQSIGRGASNVGDAISGGRRPIPEVSIEDASGLLPESGR